MNLPKYSPGYVIVYRKDDNDNSTEEGMFAIASGFLEHESWHYENHDRSVQVHESEIIGLLANGIFIPDARVNGNRPAPEYDPNAVQTSEDLADDLDEDEKAFLKAHENDNKIQVEDKSDGEQEVEVRNGKED